MGDRKQPDLTDDKVTLRGRHDFLVYYLPASVPFWAALLLGLDFAALNWIIWLELVPRGLLMGLEIFDDPDIKTGQTGVFALVLLCIVGAMAFVAMFLNDIRGPFEEAFSAANEGGLGAGAAALFAAIEPMTVLSLVAVATAARAWRAWRIDVRKDPAMAHVQHKTRERRTRRMFAFLSLILWIVLLSNAAALASFGQRFFGALATGVYCFLPFVIAYGDRLRHKLRDVSASP